MSNKENEPEKNHNKTHRALFRLLKYMVPHLGFAAVAMFFLLVAMAADLALPQVAGGAINALEGALKQAAGAGLSLWPYVVLFLGLTLAKSIARLMHGTMEIRMQQGILMDLRGALFEAAQRLSFSYHDDMNTGQLISRVTHDVDRARRVFSEVTFTLAEVLIYMIGAFVLMFLVSPKLAFFSLCPAPIAILLLTHFASKMRPMWKEVMDRYGDVTTALQENIAGARVVRAFAKETNEIDKFGNHADTFISRLVKAVDYWAGRMPLTECLFGVSMPIALCCGSVLVMHGEMEVGDIVKFVLYLMGISHRISRISRLAGSIQEAAASADRIFGVLDEAPKIRNAPQPQPMPEGKGRVEFLDVCFGYDGGKNVLDGIGLTVEPGRTVAVIGRTGAGKTALVNLLSRFYEVTAGRVLIDGTDVRLIDLAQLRRAVGFIFQEIFLFSTTVAENIAYGKPDATREEIERCARAAQAEPFIVKLEKGYDTVVGERGVTLSGGEKQRIAIARALIMNPRILVMDDATASVDSQTERFIHEAMDEIARDRTTFVVAQRLSTARKADTIIVLEDGKIAESGTHEELMRKKGIYREIHDEQFAGEVFL